MEPVNLDSLLSWPSGVIDHDDCTSFGSGYHRYPPKRRNLQRHTKVNDHGDRAIALSRCKVTRADGSYYYMEANGLDSDHFGAPVRIRPIPLRAHITSYIDVALRVGLNAAEVGNLYRLRTDNGFGFKLDEAKVSEGASGWDQDNRS